MMREEYRLAVLDVIYLASCAINNRIPDRDRVNEMDLSFLYQAARRNLLDGITAMALESAGVKDDRFTQAMGKSMRKEAAFDVERGTVLGSFEKAGIWYAPLKGCVIKDLYPRIGMRQMSDIDILFDPSRTEDVRMIMEGLGFEAYGSIGTGVHDIYHKAPIFNFEMHRALFGVAHDNKLCEYYADVKDILIPGDDNNYGYHFSDEDFYIYMISHEYKHYTGSGTGIRSLLDTYVFLTKKADCLNYEYINAEIGKLGLTEYEAQNRTLALRLFEGGSFGKEEEDMLESFLSSGTYGSLGNFVSNGMKRYANTEFPKVKYVLRRIFIPVNYVRANFPLFIKYPFLLPFLPFYRVGRALLFRRKRIMAELKELSKY